MLIRLVEFSRSESPRQIADELVDAAHFLCDEDSPIQGVILDVNGTEMTAYWNETGEKAFKRWEQCRPRISVEGVESPAPTEPLRETRQSEDVRKRREYAKLPPYEVNYADTQLYPVLAVEQLRHATVHTGAAIPLRAKFEMDGPKTFDVIAISSGATSVTFHLRPTATVFPQTRICDNCNKVCEVDKDEHRQFCSICDDLPNQPEKPVLRCAACHFEHLGSAHGTGKRRR